MKCFLVLFWFCVCVWCLCVHVCGGALTSVGVDGVLRLTVGCLPSHSSALVLNFLTVILARVASQHPARSVCICAPSAGFTDVCCRDLTRLGSSCLVTSVLPPSHPPSPNERLPYSLFHFYLRSPVWTRGKRLRIGYESESLTRK